ncbi:MAG: benzoyl-CoA 2,3-epoxidase subunit BoxB [Geodermatophilaceae bacterium]
MHRQGSDYWTLAMTRELDDLILHLRTNELELGTWLLRTEGDATRVLAHDQMLIDNSGDWLANEVLHYLKRTLKRLDVTSRSLIALIEPGSCFAGSLLELALAADRSYMLDGVFEDTAVEDSDDVAPPAAIIVTALNDGLLPMGNDLSRLGTRFFGQDDAVQQVKKRLGEAMSAAEALEFGLVTFGPDDLDWEDEVRLAVEERASFSPDALTGLEANYRFAGPETVETKIFGRLTAWQNWIFNRPNASGADGALRRFGTGQRADLRPEAGLTLSIDYAERIPNNVDLHEDRRLQRALESWQPSFLGWWQNMGPTLPTEDVYLRTAVNVGREGWAHFGHVAMNDYRWGIFLAERDGERKIAFGQHKGEPAWQKVPGEYRSDLRRLIVIQGDTEPASVEQQRNLGATAPSLYDLRNLFQVNVEEGRHLWAMVYLLHAYFGRDGREEAEALLLRNSGSDDAPRILGAFNEETPDWLSFFMFTYFTDRDGKYQLGTLKESAFDPLSRTCEFMLKEESHHMFVGTTGIDRVVERTVQIMVEHDTDDAGPHGAIPLSTIQKYINFHYTVSLDLFGGEQSTNVANYFTAGIKGRWMEERRKDDHTLLDDSAMVDAVQDGQVSQVEIPALLGLNQDLRGSTSRTARTA